MTQDDSRSAAENCWQPKTGRKTLQVLLASLFLLALCAVIRYYWGAAAANADPADQRSEPTEEATTAAIRPSDSPQRVASSTNRSAPPSTGKAARGQSEEFPASSVPAVVATVNTQRITRDDLARECLRHCGKEVLESMVNKLLIVQECQRQGITVTRDEVDAEIQRMSKRFNIPVDQWLKLLEARAERHARTVRQRHHLADAGPEEAGGRAVDHQPRGVAARNTRRNTARWCAPG